MDITRDTALTSVLFIVFGLALYLIVRAIVKRENGRLRIANAIAGGLMIVVLVAARPDDFLGFFTLDFPGIDGAFGIVVVAASILLGLAIGDYVFGRLVPAAASVASGDQARASTLEPIFAVASGLVLAVGIWLAIGLVDPPVQGAAADATNISVELVAEFDLPAEPRDLVFSGTNTGYISFPESIARFVVTGTGDEAALELEEVAGPNEINNPRGLALTDDYLFVAEQGEQQDDAPEGLFSANGQVVRFTVTDGGELTERVVLIDEIPIAGVLHGINGFAVDEDGLIHVSVGGTRGEVGSDAPNPDWLGTVLRFDADARDIDIYARGLRNVYDLEFDDDGRLWGVDNDGPTHRGYRAEEVLQIKEDQDYGYPEEGTFGAGTARTDRPIWAFMGVELEGSAGIELADRIGLETGLLIGARVLTYFPYSEDDDGIYAAGDFDVGGERILFSRQGYFTIVEAADDGLLYVGVTGLTLQSNLYLLEITES